MPTCPHISMTFECKVCGPLLDVDLNDDPELRKDNYCRRHSWHTVKYKNFTITIYPRDTGVWEITTPCGYCNEPIVGKFLEKKGKKMIYSNQREHIFQNYSERGYSNPASSSTSKYFQYGFLLEFGKNLANDRKNKYSKDEAIRSALRLAKIPCEEVWYCSLSCKDYSDICINSLWKGPWDNGSKYCIHFKGSTFKTAESLVCSECLANEGKNSSNRKRPHNPQEHHTPHYDDDEDDDDEDEGVNNNSGGRRRFGPGYS